MLSSKNREFDIELQTLRYLLDLPEKYKEVLIKALEVYDDENKVHEIVNNYLKSKSDELFLGAKKCLVKRAMFIVDRIELIRKS